MSDVAWDIINLTNYPETELGVKKLIIGTEVEGFTTGIMASTTDNELSAKEHLQTIAHACGVQMYIDRGGYLHLDNEQRVSSVVYTLPLESQAENPTHSKEQMPKKLTIPIYNDSIEVDLKGGGESMEVENPFIVTTTQGEELRDIVLDHFIKYRNLAEITYRGEPALDILDHITLSTKFPDDPTVEAIVVGSTLNFDGTINGNINFALLTRSNLYSCKDKWWW